VIFELTPRESSLEATFMELTGDSVQYHAHLTAGSMSDIDGRAA
jgi:hypothetical protein